MKMANANDSKKKEKKKTKDTQMKKEDANCLDSQII